MSTIDMNMDNENKTAKRSLSPPEMDLNQLIQLKRKMKQANEQVKEKITKKNKKQMSSQDIPQKDLSDGAPGVGEQQISSVLKGANGGDKSPQNLNGGGGGVVIPGQVIKKEFIDLKAHFMSQLPRLQSLDTRQSALKECELIIDQNRTQEGLRIFISSISEFKRPQNFSTNESEVFLLGIISDSFALTLNEPLDSSKSPITATFRLAELITRYFKDSNSNVQLQCCKAWKQIYRSQLLNSPIQDKLKILYLIPASFHQGGKDTIAQVNRLYEYMVSSSQIRSCYYVNQTTSTMVISSMLEFALKIKDIEFVTAVAHKYFPNIYFKSFVDSPSLILSVQHIVSTVQLKNLQQYMPQIIGKTLSFLVNQESKSISYKIKAEACELLAQMARQFQEISQMIIGQYHDDIIPVLQESTKDRTLKVQTKAKIALREWQLVKQKCEELEAQKMVKKQQLRNPNGQFDADKIISQKTENIPGAYVTKKRPENVSETILLDDHGMKNVLNRQGGYVNDLKAKNFLTKFSGIGGGRTHLDGISGKPSKITNKQAHLKQSKQLSEFINGKYQEQRAALKTQKLLDNVNTTENYLQQNDNEMDKNAQFDEDDLPFDKFENNFYNSQLPTLLEIQKKQQTLIDGQLQLYPQHKNQQQQIQQKGNIENDPFQYNKKQNDEIDSFEETQDYSSKQSISELWQTAITMLEKDNHEAAFNLISNSGDDIYLIRLLMRSGIALEKLRRDTALRVVSRFQAIHQANFVNRLCADFYLDSYESGLHDKLTIEDKRSISNVQETLFNSPNQINQELAHSLSKLNILND